MAVGHGKKAARHIDAYLRATSHRPGAKHAPADFERVDTWYFSDAPAQQQPRLELARHVSTFDEVVQGLDEFNALLDARRCPAGTASSETTATASARTTRSPS
ncbi:hypothetical protein [Streptomyces sp. NPDC054940]